MKKRMTREEKTNLAIKDLINEMFKIAGYSIVYEDLIGRTDDWFTEYTMTEEQYDQWIKWSTDYLRKNLKYSKARADKDMSWFSLMYGLKVRDIV